MGWTPVNNVEFKRDFASREIVVKWMDEVSGQFEMRFGFDKAKEAFDFALEHFTEKAM